MKILENILLKDLTTMRLGGPAKYVLEVEEPADIIKAFDFVNQHHLPYYILGGGANTIAHDEGFNGAIIRNVMSGIDTVEETQSLRRRDFGARQREMERRPPVATGRTDVTPSEAMHFRIMGGTPWDDVVKFTTEKGLTGIEALSKIPGLSGAAPVQNIGAYGQDISAVFVKADVYDIKTREFKTLGKDDFHFSYRHSIMNTTEQGRYFVISIFLGLKKGQMSRPFYNSIERYISEHNITDFSPASIRNIVSAIRADKLPDPAVKASAGSFFKNIYLSDAEATTAEAKGYPVYRGHDGLKINSAWLIEQAGLKGALLHGFRINEKAPLVLINESATSYNDLAAARAEIIAKVHDKFGYTLEQEPMEITQ